MAKFRDPTEIYLESLDGLSQPASEERPPEILRAEVWPYPDLTRLWVRFEISPFSSYPSVSLRVLDPEAAVVATMFLIEIRAQYQSVTMHLRQPPQPGAAYQLEIGLSRSDVELDGRSIPFALVSRDPGAGQAGK